MRDPEPDTVLIWFGVLFFTVLICAAISLYMDGPA